MEILTYLLDAFDGKIIEVIIILGEKGMKRNILEWTVTIGLCLVIAAWASHSCFETAQFIKSVIVNW